MRAVLDTVVYVRAMINRESRWGRLIFELSERYTVVFSPPIIKEILGVLNRPELRQRFPQITDVTLFELIHLFGTAKVVQPVESIAICRDPKDDKFFECAVAAGANYIVSEDRDILDIGEFRGVRTLTAGQFLAVLDERR